MTQTIITYNEEARARYPNPKKKGHERLYYVVWVRNVEVEDVVWDHVATLSNGPEALRLAKRYYLDERREVRLEIGTEGDEGY